MSSSERKIRQKEALRTGILAAARNIALQEGWPAVTIRKIADEVEYTPPIVYEYFENKEGVLYEVAMEGFRLLRSKLEAEQESSPGQRLFRYALIHWEFAQIHPEYYKLMFGMDGLPSIAKERPKEVTATGEVIANTIREISRISDEAELREVLFQWTCIVNGFIMIALIMEDKLKEQEIIPEEFLERATRRFIKSIT